MDQLISDIIRWYDLQTACYRENARFEELQEMLKQAIWEHRTKNQAITEYSSSLRRLLDKFTGKSDKLDALRREDEMAHAKLQHTKWQWQTQKQISEELKQQCESIPTPEELRAAAQQNPQALELLSKRELMLCSEMLRPLLEKTLEALEEYRQYLRGGRAGEILTREQIQGIGAAHIRWADKSRELLQRLAPSLETLGIPLEIPSYFQSPGGYVVAAAKHNQLDRMNAAIAQVEKLQRSVREIEKQEP